MVVNFDEKELLVNLKDKEAAIFERESIFLRKRSPIVLDKKFFSDYLRVKDTHRYNIVPCGDKWDIANPSGLFLDKFSRNDFDQEIDPRNENIVIILESPHEDEYSGAEETLAPLGPAMGQTGRNIHKYFCTHALPILLNMGMSLDYKKEYALCIVNPIPFQTSLTAIHGKGLVASLRNKVWKALWEHCRHDFEKRIRRYYPKIVLNGCTSELKTFVNPIIKSPGCGSAFNIPHPSYWHTSLGGFRKA
jgi:hypothetical protein